ncbi:concanavalin A-like lectin/glucanases family protein [Bacteriovorax sp. BSW11_IV]|nr:concanavalin A-like lectin/glucanases family protein [Bacteriovorax sp. BSW11_IV]
MDKVAVSSVQIINNQLRIHGTGLIGAKNIKIQSDAVLENFSIESISDTLIVANALKVINFKAQALFNLVISDSFGAATFPITFEIQDGAVTAAKLHHMNANDGDVLIFNDSTQKWEPRPLSGLSYKGTWDASSDIEPSASATAGDYWVTSVSGITTFGSGLSFSSGDWIIFNGTDWQKVANTSDVVSFNGRQGVVTPSEGDYSIDQLSDVDTSTSPPSNGQVLKWDGSKWAPAVDSTGVASGSVTSGDITDNSITDADINSSANISQSKIQNLLSDLSSKLSLTGGTLSGALDMGGNNIGNIGTVDGVDIPALSTSVTNNTSNISINAGDILALQGSASSLATDISNLQNKNVEAMNTACSDGQILEASGGNFVCANMSATASNYWVQSGSDIYYNSGNVAIGAATSGVKVGIGGSLYNSAGNKLHIVNTSSSSIIGIGEDSNNYGEMFWNDLGNYIGFSTKSAGTSYSGVLVIKDGKVGIGDTNPNEKLDVAGKVRATEFCIGVDCVSAWPSGGGASGTVTSISAGVGLTGGTITTSGTLAVDVGVAAGKIPQLDSSGKLPTTVETDPSVSAFAKAALPTCLAGQVLKSDGTSLTCVSDIDTDTDTNTTYTAGGGLLLTSTTFSIAAQGILDTNLSGLSSSCANGQILLTNGLGSFSCGDLQWGENLGDLFFNTGSVTIGGTTADSSAIFDIQSNSKGLLPPRMTTAQRNAISSPAEGLMVYDLDEKKLYNFSNGAWTRVNSGALNLSSVTPLSMTFSPAPIALYSFDDNTLDASGLYDGTPTSIGYIPGRFNKAAYFDGSTSRIVLPNSLQTFFGSDFTASVWVKLNTNSGSQTIFNFRNSAADNSSSDRKAGFLNISNGEWQVTYKGSSNGSQIQKEATFGPNVGEWYHVVIRKMGNDFTFFLNGELVPELGATTSGTTALTSNLLQLGRHAYSGAITGYLDGALDDFAMWDQSLSDVKIAEIYNMGKLQIANDVQLAITSNSIGTSHIVDGAISSDDLASGSVTLDKVDFASNDGINIPQLTSDPVSGIAGQTYFNTTTKTLMVHDGTSWVAVSSAGSGVTSTNFYESTWTTVAASTKYTFAHGLSEAPLVVQVLAKNNTTGIITMMSPQYAYGYSTYGGLNSVSSDATNVYVRTTADRLGAYSDAGAGGNIDFSNSTIRVVAWTKNAFGGGASSGGSGSPSSWENVPLADTSSFDINCEYRFTADSVEYKANAVSPDKIQFNSNTMNSNSTSSFISIASSNKTSAASHQDNWSNNSIGSAKTVTNIVKRCGAVTVSEIDNLGNHTATENLDLGTNKLVGNGGISGIEISASGNVGIGVSSPSERLDVNGKVKGTEICIGSDCRASWPVIPAETDPTVSSFAKTALPTCGAGTVLKSDGTSFSCVTDVDTTYSAGSGLSLTGTTFSANLSASNIPTLDASKITTGSMATARLPASTSYLGNSIESTEITDGTIAAADLASSSVTTAKIATGAVTSAKLGLTIKECTSFGTSTCTVYGSVYLAMCPTGYYAMSGGGACNVNHYMHVNGPTDVTAISNGSGWAVGCRNKADSAATIPDWIRVICAKF